MTLHSDTLLKVIAMICMVASRRGEQAGLLEIITAQCSMPGMIANAVANAWYSMQGIGASIGGILSVTDLPVSAAEIQQDSEEFAATSNFPSLIINSPGTLALTMCDASLLHEFDKHGHPSPYMS